ncbi:hypothetical protein N781_14190 [Pontibacillus halophilus JSM 076056 = DSM 19796]|uniref:Polysaccharide biosynthesis protein n=1 Tax=Pontibacillus halophilus JSM 076056 = DSM 19796 TaxID=1385510 RepID=A0A0A5IB57_9BACI|nr:hypothetical protein N781_14190 [Pontibacillus halophilus JSM 076056 = DSM 19796]
MAGTTVSNLFIVLTTPLLTMLYTPEEFGVLSVYLSLVYSVSVIASLEYDQAIPIPTDRQEAFHVFLLSLLSVVCVAMITVLMGTLLPIGTWFQSPQLDEWVWLLGMSVLFLGWYQVFNSWAVREEGYASMSRSKVNMNTGQMVSQIGLGFIGVGYIGLLVGEVIGRVMGCFTFWRRLFGKGIRTQFSMSLSGMWKVMIRFRKFPLMVTWPSLMNSLSGQIPTFFLAAVFGVEVAGVYLIAQKLLNIPEGLIAFSVSQVYLSELAIHMKEYPLSIPTLFFKTLQKMILLGGAITFLIVIFGPAIISLLFDEAWGEAGGFLRVLAILTFFRMAIKPILGNFYVLEEQTLLIVGEVVHTFCIAVSLVVAYTIMKEPLNALLCMSLLASLGIVLQGCCSYLAMKRWLKRNRSLEGGVIYDQSHSFVES